MKKLLIITVISMSFASVAHATSQLPFPNKMPEELQQEAVKQEAVAESFIKPWEILNDLVDISSNLGDEIGNPSWSIQLTQGLIDLRDLFNKPPEPKHEIPEGVRQDIYPYI